MAWIGLILAVTLQRSIPGLPPSATNGALGVGVLACLLIVAGPNRAAAEDGRLVLWLLAVPVVAAGLTIWRDDWSNLSGPAASVLALLAAARLDVRSRARSAWLALAALTAASVVLGVVMPSVVEPNARSFLRFLYDGRLFGLLQTPNVLGEASVLLIMLSFSAANGRQRLFGIGLGSFAMVASSSQTALGAAALALVLWAVWRLFGNAAIVWLGGIAIAALCIDGIFIHPRGLIDFGNVWSSLTFSSRTNIWRTLLAYDIPFTGLGQARIDTIFAGTVIQGATGVGSAHSIWVDAYVRDGIPGVTALVVAVMAMLRYGLHRRSALPFMAFGAFMIEGFLEVTPTHAPFYALFFIAITASGWSKVLTDPAEVPVGAVPDKTEKVTLASRSRHRVAAHLDVRP